MTHLTNMTDAELRELDEQITPKQLHILRHALGFNSDSNEFRNYFVTNEESADWNNCLELCGRGLMKRRAVSGSEDFIFYATEAGKDIARNSGASNHERGES